MTPEVSVVVPVYDRARVIGACIESLLDLDYPEGRVELIVVDNGSRDGTLDVLRGYDGRIRIETEAKRGPAAARNAGVRAARGQFVAFTDSDCVVEPTWLARLVAPLRDPEVGVSGGRIRALPDGNEVEHFGERIHDHAKAINYFRPAYVITMNIACRLELIRSLGLFEERLLRCEDVDFAYRVAQAGRSLVYVPDAIVYHRNRGTIPALMQEAYLHGYHGEKLHRLHEEFIRSLEGSEAEELPESARTSFSRELWPYRERFYWSLFRAAKRVGKVIGRPQASRLYHDV